MVMFKMLDWELLHPQMTFDHLGFIPNFVLDGDPRPAREQFDDRYKPGGGWRPFKGHTMLPGNKLKYPGDPPLQPLAKAKLRDETIYFYDGAWVAIVQPDDNYEVARID